MLWLLARRQGAALRSVGVERKASPAPKGPTINGGKQDVKHRMAAFFMAMASFPAYAGICRVQMSSQEDHSAIAQRVMVDVERGIQANRRLALASLRGGHDVQFHLISAPPERRPYVTAADPFLLFFVLTDRNGKFLSADTLRCAQGSGSCVASVMREVEDACNRMPGR